MSKIVALTFHIGETWEIAFSCKQADGATALPLPEGSIVALRFDDITGTSIILTCSSDDGTGAVAIGDTTRGTGTIVVTPEMQTAASFGVGVYKYELRIETLGMTSVQAEGRLTVSPSLFAPALP